MIYRKEIDGLRALAVVPVILFHAGFAPFSGGFVGVDVFFVISGYLITSILISDLQKGQFSILRFYERRARRILPALFAVMAACLPFAWAWMLPHQLRDFSESLIATSLFASNILFWRESGYFAPAAEEKPLLHTWSLAVEEQYYVVFPIFLMLMWRFGRNPVFWTIAALAALSLMLAELGWRRDPTATFYLAPTRAWELFAGSLAAFGVDRRGVGSNNALAALGLVAVILAIFGFDETVPFPSLYAVVPVGGVVLIILYGDASTLVARLLSQRWLVGIGLISYSAYLWHQPLFAFARIRTPDDPGPMLMGGLCLLSFGLAILSWRYVEQPFRQPRAALQDRPQLFAASLVGLVVFAVIGGAGVATKGFDGRFDAPDWAPAGTLALPRVDQGYCFYSFNLVGDLPVGPQGQDCHLGAPRPTPTKALLFGDSFAGQWEPFWDDLGKAGGFSVNAITTNWCFPALDDASTAPPNHVSRQQCHLNRAYVANAVAHFDLIILAGAWNGIAAQGHAESVTEFVDHVLAQTDVPIVIHDTPVALDRGSVEARIYGVARPLRLDAASENHSRRFWTTLAARYGDTAQVTLLGRPAMFGDDALLTPSGHPYSIDGAHVSIFGALAAAAQFRSTPDHGALMQAISR